MSAVEVVAAVRDDGDGRYWVARRTDDGSHGGLAGMWEYPGGKVEVGENHEEALVREMHEEFGVDIGINHPITSIVTAIDAQDYRVNFFDVMFCGLPELRCHDRVGWFTVPELLEQDHLPSGQAFNARLALGELVNADLLSDLQGAADHYGHKGRDGPVADPEGLKRLRGRARRLRALHTILERLT